MISILLNFMSAELTKLASQRERLIGLMEEVKTLKLMAQQRKQNNYTGEKERTIWNRFQELKN